MRLAILKDVLQCCITYIAYIVILATAIDITFNDALFNWLKGITE